MFFTDFYKVNHTDTSSSGTIFHIELNPGHDIYKAHFPGQPVLPGACTLQIIKECAQQMLNKKLQYSRINLCKFLRYVDPVQCNEIKLTISFNENEDGSLQMISNGTCEDSFFIKTKAIMKVK